MGDVDRKERHVKVNSLHIYLRKSPPIRTCKYSYIKSTQCDQTKEQGIWLRIQDGAKGQPIMFACGQDDQ
jgi:hypothetical protein